MIRVLVVDDSAIIRQVLTRELSKSDDIEVIGSAIDPYEAREKIVNLEPDVITLDLEMPRMNGLAFLAKLMKYFPIPVIVVSSFTPERSDAALKALELGAVDVICKPGTYSITPDISRRLTHAIRAAASAKLGMQNFVRRSSEESAAAPLLNIQARNKVIAIGASTGGVKAIENVLSGLPSDAPGTLVVQHMPENFTASFSAFLNRKSRGEVREAHDNDCVEPGLALVAPGNHHMLLRSDGDRIYVKVKDGPRVHYQRPSVDVLFQSVAKTAGKNAVGVLLTGMGSGGARGLLEMRESGVYPIAQ